MRRRQVFAADKRARKVFHQVAKNIAFRKGLYDLPNPSPDDLGYHIDLWGYESGLTAAIDQLIDRDTLLEAKAWLNCLVPFVAGLFARGPDLNGGNNNEMRIMAFQEMLAPVMAARWTVLHYPDGSVVTSDRAAGAIRTPVGPGLAIPLDTAHALLLTYEAERVVVRYDDVWRPVIDHLAMESDDAVELRAAVVRFALNVVVGPTRQSVTIDPATIGTDNAAWPGVLVNPQHCDLHCHLYDYFRVQSAVRAGVGDGQKAAERIDLDAAETWLAPLAVMLDLEERTVGGVTVNEGESIRLSMKLGLRMYEVRTAAGDWRGGAFSLIWPAELQERDIALGLMCRDDSGDIRATEIRDGAAGRRSQVDIAELSNS